MINQTHQGRSAAHGSETMPVSLLYIPAHQAELYDKAIASDAQAIIIDLEDAVPAVAKELARETLLNELAPRLGKKNYVRLNHDPQLLVDDLQVIAGLDIDGVIIPRAELEITRQVMQELPTDLERILLIETARGLNELDSLAEFATSFAIGRVDLMADLRMNESRIELLFPILLDIVVKSAAHGLAAPIAPAHLNVRDRDRDSIHKFSQDFFDLGFRSQTAIHPYFCELIHEVFLPSVEEYQSAQNYLAEFAESAGLCVDAGGNFVDPAVLRKYQEVVSRFEYPSR
ncbi:MAG: aldolase/citrate lyase family protein [Microbacteriaceae bacterium]